MATPEGAPVQLRPEQIRSMQEAQKKAKEEEMLKLWERMSKRDISNLALRGIVESNPILREKAAEKILQQNPGEEDFVCIIRWVPKMREECWKLLSLKPSKASLVKVIIFATDLSERAWTLFLSLYPNAGENIQELEYLAKYAPPAIKRGAQKMLPESRLLEMQLTGELS